MCRASGGPGFGSGQAGRKEGLECSGGDDQGVDARGAALQKQSKWVLMGSGAMGVGRDGRVGEDGEARVVPGAPSDVGPGVGWEGYPKQGWGRARGRGPSWRLMVGTPGSLGTTSLLHRWRDRPEALGGPTPKLGPTGPRRASLGPFHAP